MHPKTKKAKEEWMALADEFGFEDDKEMLYFLYWIVKITPKCMGCLLEKTPQAISWHMTKLGISLNRLRKKTEIKKVFRVSFTYTPVNSTLSVSGSPCKNCHYQYDDKNLCDCDVVNAYQRENMYQPVLSHDLTDYGESYYE